jgi:hypothetical protein
MSTLIKGVLQANGFREDGESGESYVREVTGLSGITVKMTVTFDQAKEGTGRLLVERSGGEEPARVLQDKRDTASEVASDAIAMAHQLLKVL